MRVNNLKELEKELRKRINNVLDNEVVTVAKENMVEATQTSVYDVYDPKYYVRRLEDGGLLDINNIDVQPVTDGIILRNFTPLDNARGDYDLDDIIVHGYGTQPFPRDFYGATIENLKDNKEHIIAMKKGLERQGFKVRIGGK